MGIGIGFMAVIAITILLTLLLSAFCSITEASFYSVSNTVVESLQRQKKFTGKYIAHVKKNIDTYIASVLILNTLTNTMGVYMATSLGVHRLGYIGQMILPIVLTVSILLFGEITPKTVGVKKANKVAPIVAVPFYYITIILKWTGLIWVCIALTKRWTKHEKKPDVSIEDINSLVTLGLREEVIDRQQASVIKNILALKSIYVRKIMTPRQVVFSLSGDLTIGDSIDKRGSWPFSRVPIYSESKDCWIGIVLRRGVYNKLGEG